MNNQNRLFEEKPFESKNIFALSAQAEPSGQKIGRFNISTLNLTLLILVVFLGVWYAVWSNFVISAQYYEKIAREKLDNLLQENNQLLSEKSSSANLGALLVFAKNSGLIEQKNIEYLFDRSNVAKR